MRFSAFKILELALALAAPGILAQRPIQDAFFVDFSSNNQGGCQYLGQQNANDIFSDAYALVRRGIQAVDDYNTRPEAKRLLDSFFSATDEVLEPAELPRIRATYDAVRNWMETGAGLTGKPYLFCHSTWLVKRQMSDPAWLGPNQEYKDLQGNTVLIRDNAGYVQKQRDTASALGKSASSVYPYYSYKHLAYLFDQGYPGGTGPNGGYCSPSRNAGATQHIFTPSSITICPSTFGGTNANPRPNIRRLRAGTTLRPVPRATVETNRAASQSFEELFSAQLPSASTLFHELFHLILGNEATFPDIGEVYEMDRLVNLDYQYAVVNPETYTAVAVAYDYTVNDTPDAAGNRVEFHSGRVTKGA